jgi:hypothetical protein
MAHPRSKEAKYVVSPDAVLTRLLEGEAVILDLNTQRYFSINEVAIAIWEAMEAPAGVEDVVGRLLEVYEIDEASLVGYVEGFVGKMVDKQLIRRVS